MARSPGVRAARSARRPQSRRRRQAAATFDALQIEGALIAPAQMALIADGAADGQEDAGYAVRHGLSVRDELPLLFKIAQSHMRDLLAAPPGSHAAAVRFTEVLLRDVLGFTDLAPAGPPDRIGSEHGRPAYPVTLLAGAGRVPVVVSAREHGLDAFSPDLERDGQRSSAALAVQDWLNAGDSALWGLACDGNNLRLLRRNPSLTRPAFIEADIRRICETDAFADFAALFLLMHATRFGQPGTPPTDCALESWRDAGQKAGIAARERLKEGVKQALVSLGSGFVASNPALRVQLQDNTLPLSNFRGLLLRLVYRMIFLLVAEDRGLLHPPDATPEARRLYTEGYSLSRLRDRAIRRASRDAYDDLWDGMLIVFDRLGRLGEPSLGLPALDGLFTLGGLGPLSDASLPNRALMDAVFGLAWLRHEGALVPVNWRDMKTEELGSVYESLLELTPRLSEDGRAYFFASEVAETRGNERKTTGSYYTPDSLVQLLLDSALDPVLDRVEREARNAGQDQAEALLDVTVLDPACGSGHFLLAAAARIAARVARIRGSGAASAQDYHHALREVARRCLHGVDRNPMAVELAQVALWIETVEPGRPLGFLDANIRCGDALLGVFDLAALNAGIPDAAFKPLAGDDGVACRELLVRNRDARRGQGVLDVVGAAAPRATLLVRAEADWRTLPEESPEQIGAKRIRQAAARADPESYALSVACDLYVATFLAPKPAGAAATPGNCVVPTTADVWRRRDGGQIYPPREGRNVDMARSARAFHWPLEFATIMERGGFDVVLGNPPWERIKLQEKEFFATEAPEIAAASNAAARGRMIAALAAAMPGSRERKLFETFEQAKRTAEASSIFARVPGEDGGRFPLAGRGDVNTYALFAELFSRVTSARGRAGLIVPTGLATSDTLKTFFSSMTTSGRLISSYNFFEVRQWFVDTDDRSAFGLFTFGHAVDETEFTFSMTNLSDMSEPERRIRLSPAAIRAINPNTQTAPMFRTRRDAELTARIYARVPVFVEEARGTAGNPWGVTFAAMFHMSNDSGLFRTAAQLAEAGLERDGTTWMRPASLRPAQSALALAGGRDDRSLQLDGGGPAAGERWLPLYEAKMIHQFDHRWATYDAADARDATTAEKADPAFEPASRYWVPEREVTGRTFGRPGWLLGWRDIARATDERTAIFDVIPRVGVGHTFPLLFASGTPAQFAALLGNLNTLVLDYVARQKIGGTHLTYGFLNQFAVLPPTAYTSESLDFIVPRVLELTYTSHSLAHFARDLGHYGPPFAWDEPRRANLRTELDAWYARAYDLSRDDLRYILDPADLLGPEYPSETFRVLKANEIRAFGEYRTQRLVLAAWDAQEAARHSVITLPDAARVRVPPRLRSARDWARPVADAPAKGLQTLAQVSAILQFLTGPTPARQAMLAALYALEPHRLTVRLAGAERDAWRRVVGDEANPPPSGVIPFGLGGASGWGDALAQLRAQGALIEDGAADTWAPGASLLPEPAGSWPERGGFALDVAARVLADGLSAEETEGLVLLAA